MAGTRLGGLRQAAARAGISTGDYLARLDAGEKRCWKCRKWRSVDAFGTDPSRADGRAAICQACRHVLVRVVTKGRPSAFKGQAHTDEARRKMSAARKGKPGNTAKRLTPEQRALIVQRTRERAMRGADHWNWRGGVTERHRRALSCTEYRDWRTTVFARDGYACRRCGDASGGNLNAHHVKPWATHPDLRFDVANGLTLCENCHVEAHRGAP